MGTKAGKHVRNVWIEIKLHDQIKELAAKSKRNIKDTVEIVLLYGMPKLIEEINQSKILSKNNEERSFDEVLSQE